MKVTCMSLPGSLLGIRNDSWDASSAISEFVDNSYGEDRGNANRIDVWWDKRRRMLTVLDDGRGMSNVSYLFCVGAGAGVGEIDIGCYGQGGSRAILWLADVVDVWTMTGKGLRAHTRQDLYDVVVVKREWPEVDNAWVPVRPSNVPADLRANGHGTMIRMRLRDGRNFWERNIKIELSKRYAPALRAGRKIVWHDHLGDEELLPWDPGESGLEVDEALEVNGLKARLYAAVAPKIHGRDSCISVNYGGRQLFRSKDAFGDYDGGKIYGYIDLAPGWRSKLSTTKNDIDDEGLKDGLMKAACVALQPLFECADELETEVFEANLTLECNVAFASVLAKLGAKRRPEPRPIPPEPRPPSPDPPEPRPPIDDVEPGDDIDAPSGLRIILRRGDPDTMDGQYLEAGPFTDEGITIFWNPGSPRVVAARDPLNRQWWLEMVGDVLHTELAKRGLLAKSGVITEEKLEELRSAHGDYGDARELRVAHYIKPLIAATMRKVPA